MAQRHTLQTNLLDLNLPRSVYNLSPAYRYSIDNYSSETPTGQLLQEKKMFSNCLRSSTTKNETEQAHNWDADWSGAAIRDLYAASTYCVLLVDVR